MTGGERPAPSRSSRSRDRPERLRYEITVDGEPAGFTEYTDHRGVRTFVHTEIDDRVRGHGARVAC